MSFNSLCPALFWLLQRPSSELCSNHASTALLQPDAPMVSPLLSLSSSQFDNIPDSSCSITLKHFAMRTEVQALWDVFRIDYHHSLLHWHVLPFSSLVVLAKATVTITVSYTNYKYLCVFTYLHVQAPLTRDCIHFPSCFGFCFAVEWQCMQNVVAICINAQPFSFSGLFLTFAHQLDLTVSAACD